jgi:UDP-2,3-diacylglucosamine pyrophosphatase LpxH
MRIGIISDLHVKKKDSTCLFFYTDHELAIYLEQLCSEVDRVYLNGDVFELWKTKWLSDTSISDEIDGIFSEYPMFISCILENPKIFILIGNHDEYLKQELFRPKWKNKLLLHEELVNSAGENILIWHGQLDIFNNKLPVVGRFISYLGGWIERILYYLQLRSIYHWFRDRIRSGTFKNSTQVKQFKKDIGENGDLVCVINGHTHVNEIRRFEYAGKRRTYINTGMFDGDTRDVTVLDTETLDIVKSTVREKDFSKLKKIMSRGDVVLTRNTENKFSQLIASVSGSPYSHALLYVGNNQVIESTIGKYDGVQVSLLDKYLDGSHELAILSWKDTGKIDGIIKAFYAQMGMKYSYMQLVVDGLYLFCKKVLRLNISKNLDVNDKETVCSEALAKAAFDNGYDFAATTSPGDFIERTDVFDIKLITLNGIS